MARGDLRATAGRPAPGVSLLAAKPFEEREFAFTDRDFRFLAKLVQERTGIQMRDEKREMLYGRLVKRLRALGIPDFSGYCNFVQSDAGEQEMAELVNAVTTNLTRFFREQHHFDHLRDHALPDVMARHDLEHSNRLRVWSAGCSSGQEPYCIAMVMAAHIANLSRWNARILATDLDTSMVARGQRGLYPLHQLNEIPDPYRRRFVRPTGDGHIAMSEALQQLIAFKSLNLLHHWPMKGPFDIIFCRNVVIYFDKPTQRELFDRFADILAPGGWLYIGHSESLFKVSDRFRLEGKTVYRRVA